MDLEFNTEDVLDEAILGYGNRNEDFVLENERCGICMDVIIDRGVLDCCDNWFCFACIDNWATITNVCPLCKNEFQMITCIPVYDTIGSSKVAEDSLSRDDDWSVQVENKTLSFPSYYINEDAVICLDGDGCKIRNGVPSTEGDLPLDTSIACDSCDIWYHAVCVDFNPESTFESSWLCPRCVIDEVPQRSDGLATHRPGGLYVEKNHGPESSVEAAFSGKVSVAVADAGETAVVVSLVEEEQKANIYVNFPQEKKLDSKNDGENNMSLCNFTTSISASEAPDDVMQPKFDLQDTSLVLSLARDVSLGSDMEPSRLFNSETGNIKVSHSPPAPSLDSLLTISEVFENETAVNLHLGLSVGSSCSDQATGDAIQQKNDSEKPSLCVAVEKPTVEVNENVAGITDQESTEAGDIKRKLLEKSRDDASVERDKNIDMEMEPRKKARLDGKAPTTQKEQLAASVLNHKIRNIPEKKASSQDIMSIVQEGKHKSSAASSHPKSRENHTEDRDCSSGPRVKKIMRRASENKESSSVVESLRQEIRDAVKNKSTLGLGKNDIFDVKLLTAFRAAITGPKDEPAKKMDCSIVNAKRLMLQKGKTRENLTKKIYGNTSGRRRRAWDRDWEIEFWKHRCASGEPAKVETLKSVLDLLRRSSSVETSEVENSSKGEVKDSILSRLYLADASVFPRKEDIKPFSSITGGGVPSPENSLKDTPGKVSEPNSDRRDFSPVCAKSSGSSATSSTNSTKRSVQTSKSEAASRMALENRTGKPSSISMSSGSKVKANSMKENPGKSDDVKKDKRKWALEVLARKTALLNKDTNQEKQEDNSLLRGNYPLLAQLPADMRPVLAAVRASKVSYPVRQAQVYRLAEHFLKIANLPVIRRTAETELAVADAVNIEKDICERSGSKLVYVNLCSQMLSQRKDNSRPRRVEGTADEEESSNDNGSSVNAEEALKLAGLVSDSPPSTPKRVNDMTEKDEEPVHSKEEDPDNLFDLDSHPELDIYGDFEYDLEGEYMDSSVLTGASLASQSQQERSNSKMKVILSSFNCERTAVDDTFSHPPENVKSGSLQTKVDSPSQGNEEGISTLEVNSTSSLCTDEMGGNISLAEYEELYGPDKEPLVDLSCYDNVVRAENILPSGKDFSDFVSERCKENSSVEEGRHVEHESATGESSPCPSSTIKEERKKDGNSNSDKQTDLPCSVSKKVEAYIKAHIRPLCSSGVISVEQYRWAVSKTTDKVMKFHSKAKNANFLIKEGDKVKKLAEQYVEAAQAKK
ncbi:hypothetical protein H6P81_014384 [Aristolochia fimbriata]|uniref:Uncharacterized protein n=1 Tax=Aristolochia fimbriata TaxID=158543 RepID=A0AAV7EK53_ARIFI|nr:hypothetical protein H6P81_014384 [Aristolochia fimbriata]